MATAISALQTEKIQTHIAQHKTMPGAFEFFLFAVLILQLPHESLQAKELA